MRNARAFAEFLTVAALADTEQVNNANIARETGVSSPTVKSYCGILAATTELCGKAFENWLHHEPWSGNVF